MTRNFSTDRRPADLLHGFMTDFDLPGLSTHSEVPLFGGLVGGDQIVAPNGVSRAEILDLFDNPGRVEFNSHEDFDPHAFAPFFGSAVPAG